MYKIDRGHRTIPFHDELYDFVLKPFNYSQMVEFIERHRSFFPESVVEGRSSEICMQRYYNLWKETMLDRIN